MDTASQRAAMRDAIAAELSIDDGGLTARELATRLRRSGFSAADKSAVNAILYRNTSRFIRDESVPPRWWMSGTHVVEREEASPPLSRLAVTNWKSFEEAELGIAPITLIFGANSSGKSSLLQSILVLYQSRSDAGLVFDGDYVNVEGFSNCVHLHDVSREMWLRFEGRGERDNVVFGRGLTWSEGQAEGEVSALHIGSIDAESTFIRYNLEGVVAWTSTDLASVLRSNLGHEIEEPPMDADGSQTFFVLADDDGRPGEILGRFVDSVLVSVPIEWTHAWLRFRDAQLARIDRLFAKVHHIEPIRRTSADWVPLTAEPGVDVDDVVRHLAWEPGLLEDVNVFLDKLEVPYQVQIVRRDVGTGPEVGLRVHRVGDQRETVRLRDVGFGVGQLLPIIVAAVASTHTTLLVEQPEVHLHPRLQSRLAELFIDSMRDRKNQFVIETHSEHLLLRIQRHIAQGDLDRESVSVQYVQRLGDVAEVLTLDLNDDGTMADDWPEDFFDDRLEDLILLAGGGDDS